MELVPDAYPNVSHMDLTLVFNPQGKGYACVAQYNTDVFVAQTIRGIVEAFQGTLKNALNAPSTLLSSLQVLPESHLRLLLGEFLGAQRPEYAASKLPLARFEELAATSGTSRCLMFEEEELTYSQANAAAAAVALQLRKSGVMPGSAVSVLVERSFELPVAVFGIWKAGCIYVPCDPAYPEDRLAMYIEDSNSKAVLTTADLKGKAQGLVGNTEATVHLIPEPRTASQKAAAKVTHDLQAEDTA